MKKSAVFILILLLLPIISSVEFEIKESFDQEETFLAKVSGNFLEPILKENMFFYRGHVRIPIEYDVTKIQGEYYIYALLSDKSPANYSIVLKDIRYMKGSQISEEEITRTFSITENTADFSVKPGFIVSNENYFVEVQNLQDSKITIQVKTLIKNKTSEESGFFESLFGLGSGEVEQETSVTLMSGEIKKINFELGDIKEPTLRTIELSTDNLKYEIPAYLFTQGTQEQEKEKSFRLEPSELNISIPTNSNTTRIIYLYNTGDETLNNISLSVSDSLKPYVSLSRNEIEELKNDSDFKIEIYIFSETDVKVEGHIKAEIKNETLLTYSEISVNFIKDYVPLDEDDEIPAEKTKTCEELNGTICEKDEECDGDLVNAKDKACCLGTCKKIEKSPVGKIIGWTIILGVLGFLIWFFLKKYRGARKPIDLLKIGGEKTTNFNRPENRRPVRNSITRVIRKPVVKVVEKPVIKTIEKKIFIEKPKPHVPKYVGSSKTNTYHKSSCKFAGLIKADYKMSNDDSDFFKKLGYKPCKSCFK